MTETIGVALEDVGAVRDRFVFRPEIALLYDRRFGLEHQLNVTAAVVVEATFAGRDPAATLAERFGVDMDRAAADVTRFWQQRLAAPSRRHRTRTSGAPVRWATVDLPFPLALEVELTQACNWHCDFCYNTWKAADAGGRRGRSATTTRRASHLPMDLARRIIAEAADQGCLRMRFSGGEPTLHPEYRGILTLAADSGLDTELFTNGTGLTRDEAARLASAGLRVVLLSLHGLPSTHTRMVGNPAAAEHTWRAIRASVASGMTTVVETLICADNAGQIPTLAAQIRDAGVEHLSLMPYVPAGSVDPRRPIALRDVAEVIDRCLAATGHTLSIAVPCAPRHCLRADPVAITPPVRPEFHNHCAAGILWASISHDGRLRHCPHSTATAGEVTAGIGPLWRHRILPTVRAALTPAGACGGCTQFAACQGGCHLHKITGYADAVPEESLRPATGPGRRA
ncbi:MAG: radical SAM protein [Micromonosporaceae bacterium]|nr:radical SAM protein [Micromonosporaceae bacterium]